MFLSIFIRHWATIDHGALEVIAKRRRVCIAYIGGSGEEHRGQWKRAGEVLDAQASMGAFSIGWPDPKSLFVLGFCFILDRCVFILGVVHRGVSVVGSRAGRVLLDTVRCQKTKMGI